jgi:rubrerythrin
MDRFIHDENLKLYRKALAETSDENKRRVLRELIRQEEEKDARAGGTSKPSQ